MRPTNKGWYAKDKANLSDSVKTVNASNEMFSQRTDLTLNNTSRYLKSLIYRRNSGRLHQSILL